jgi:Tfp pilus assembly protein PilO
MKNTTAFILLLVAIGLFYAFIMPTYEKVQALQTQSNQYKDILANVEALSDRRDDLEVKYKNTPPAEIARLERILPENVDTVNLAMNFDSIAARYGISIQSIRTIESKEDTGKKVVQAKTAKPYESMTVSFSFFATYENFRKFMADIEKSLRIIDVKSVSFQATENNIYEFQVSVETYWLK